MLNDKTVDFLSDNIDCAIRVGAEVDPATVSVLLAEVPRSLVVAPELLSRYPALAIPQDLSRLPWVAISTFYQHEVELQHQEELSFGIVPYLSTDSVYVARNTALAGLGAAIVSSWAVTEDIAAGRLIEPFPQWRASPLPVHLVYPWARYYPTRLRKFLRSDARSDAAGCRDAAPGGGIKKRPEANIDCLRGRLTDPAEV